MIGRNIVNPSSWIESGVKISLVRQLYLFKFTEELQERLDELSERNKGENLKAEEAAEFEGILELDRILTLLNAKMMATEIAVVSG